ncbi:MAG: TIGR00341 family protein [Planctomycetia bacterium]|nr:TIGR00341 family protein [Planctomycetia bacterium]
MKEYVKLALFVCPESESDLIKRVSDNPYGTKVSWVAIDRFKENLPAILNGADHVVVSGDLSCVKLVLRHSTEYGFSVGLIPQKGHFDLARSYGIPSDYEEAIEIALQSNGHDIDIVFCNGEILLYKATFGRLPLLDASRKSSRWEMAWNALKRFIGLKLLKFTFVTNNGREINTAACGGMLIQQHGGNIASRRIAQDSSANDEMVALIVSAPLSIFDYLKFLLQVIFSSRYSKKLPDTIGLLKSKSIRVESEEPLEVTIDGEWRTQTPIVCEVLPNAVRLNTGEEYNLALKGSQTQKETLNIRNLPSGKDEISMAVKKSLPFFSYASEERFRDLFQALREDAATNTSYLILMLLSTLLATIGLYQNSAAVVIGAMLLAPLMTPIISLAMGLLRQDINMSRRSAVKIMLGVVIALLSAALFTRIFPHKPVTVEMLARLNPTLLDLGVAIFAGIAGAYTKAYKEMLSSLAGVAIAVALVPPLAVAGIGLGRLDFEFFSQAFLLFSTNLVGILLAAGFTFRILGYSPAVRGKAGMRLVMLMMFLIAIPLYFSYDDIVNRIVMEKSWQNDRFLVNGKYIIIQKALLTTHGHKEIMTMDILAREQLTRDDLTSLKKKIETNLSRELIIRARIIYIP